MQQNQETFDNLQLHLACQYIKICVLNRYTFCESLVKMCVTKHKYRSFLSYFFQKQDSVTYLPKRTVSKIKKPVKFGQFRIKYGIFSKYSRSLKKLVQVVGTLRQKMTTKNQSFCPQKRLKSHRTTNMKNTQQRRRKFHVNHNKNLH